MSTDADIVEKGVSVHLDLISRTPALLSALYDANLVPEQITTIKDAVRLDIICTLWEGRDAAARDMRERCAEVAEAADRPGKRWLALFKIMAGSEAMRQVIVEDIRAVALTVTDPTAEKS